MNSITNFEGLVDSKLIKPKNMELAAQFSNNLIASENDSYFINNVRDFFHYAESLIEKLNSKKNLEICTDEKIVQYKTVFASPNVK